MSRRTLATTTLGLLLAGSATASAAESDPERVRRADALFAEGRAAQDRGELALACPKLAESFALDPATGSLLALALCHEDAGRLATALAAYTDAERRAIAEGNAERVAVAREKREALTVRVPQVTLRLDGALSNAAGVTVEEDGAPLATSTLHRPRPVDPGDHRLRVTVPGHAPLVRSYTARERDRLELAIEAPLASSAEVTGPPGLGPLRIAGLAVMGAGLATVGLGTAFGLEARARNEDSLADCDAANRCGAEGKAMRLDALEAADVATGLFLGGGALVAAGAGLVIAGSLGAREGLASWRLVPAAGPGFAGASVRGLF